MNKIIAFVALTLAASACGTEDLGPSKQEQMNLSQELCEFADACDDTESACKDLNLFDEECPNEAFVAYSCLNKFGYCSEDGVGIQYEFASCGIPFKIYNDCLESNGG